jgi:hypothetical protein
MTLSRLSICLALASVCLSTAALAGDRGLAGGVVVSRPGLPLDPELLPPNTAPGDCVTRRVTGPGGAYRWDRVECDAQGYGQDDGRGHDDRWGYGHRRLEVETRGYSDDRYDDRRDDYRQAHGYDRYGGGPVPVDYRYAGRDVDGYLVWPGKTP